MANSKYEYVKSFEVDDEVMFPNLIVVKLGGHNFRWFSEVHEFDKPNDKNALDLMNSCAEALLDQYPDIVFSYGFGDEFSFVFKRTTKFYQRRASKILSLVASCFTSLYVTKWNEFFPQKKLMHPPSYRARVIRCASIEVLQAYLAWRQNDCHISNLYDSCFWKLIKSGMTENEAREMLKGTGKQEKNELLFQQFGMNYKNLAKMLRQGSCIFKAKVEEIVKYSENGTPVKRLRKKAIKLHSENISGRSFWNEHLALVKELGYFGEEIGTTNPEYIRSFQSENNLMPYTWIIIRIDGCHFHRFTEHHEFEKPNDAQALNLMNSCAMAVLEEFEDIIFSYGVSDEYSFILKRDSQLYQRMASEIVSIIVSYFTSTYVMKWTEFFPLKELKYAPSFDGRAVCYPSNEIVRHYLSWRQVDCHINNQYNTCFWMLVKSGKSKREAQEFLKGTQSQEKNELLLQQFGIDYDTLPLMFRQGSSVFRDKDTETTQYVTVGQAKEKVVVEYCNIIEQSFWKAHPSILDEIL